MIDLIIIIMAGIVLLFLLSCCFMVARLLDEEISMYGYEGKENWEREQLPDKLSESEIPANSSGIKITSVQVEQKLKLSVIGFDFVAIWHELAPYQIGERCGSCPFTCDYSGGLWFFRKYPYSYLGLYINFAANKFLLQRPYIVRFTIFNLLFVPSTNPFDNGLATEFSTASRSLSRPSAKRESSFMLDFLYRSINKYRRGIHFRL